MENSIYGRDFSAFAFTYIPAGEVAIHSWNANSENWDYQGVEYQDEQYTINLPVSLTLTELANLGGEYEPAYQGIDHLREVFNGTGIAGTQFWHELIVTHDTNVDWINQHSGDLT